MGGWPAVNTSMSPGVMIGFPRLSFAGPTCMPGRRMHSSGVSRGRAVSVTFTEALFIRPEREPEKRHLFLHHRGLAGHVGKGFWPSRWCSARRRWRTWQLAMSALSLPYTALSWVMSWTMT